MFLRVIVACKWPVCSLLHVKRRKKRKDKCLIDATEEERNERDNTHSCHT